MADEIEVAGIVRGKRMIELAEEVPLPDGARVRLLLIPENGHGHASDEEAAVLAESEKTLQAISKMRHQGRSIQKP
jgi:hypothetical protein